MELVIIVVHALFMLFCTCHQDHFEISTINKKVKCSFNHNKLTVDCTGKNLTRIPTFRKSIKTLILRKNQIQDIPNGIFSSHGALEVLDLSHNSLTNLRSGSFKGLVNLLRLNLNSNKLGKHNVTLPKSCFKYLKKLRHLSLKKNSFTKFPDISSIRSLQVLNATFINGMTFYQQSASLKNLAYLDLSGPSSCKPKALNKDTFSALTRLLYLDVSNNDLRNIMKGTFLQMKYLQYLDISYNPRLGLLGVENVTHDLPRTSIRVFKFQKIVLTFSMNQMLMINQIKPLNETKIREIYADSNRIQLVEFGAISYLPNTIEKISIGENWLSYGAYIFELQKLSTKIINASFLSWSHDPREEDTGWCVSGENSMEIDKTFNTCMSDHGTPVSGITKRISPLKLDYFKTINLPKNLKELYYTSCKLQFEIPKLNFSNNKLEKVDFSSNIFYSLKGPLVNLKHLNCLDLSNNFCSNISTVFFSGTPNIKTLMLQNNLLGFILPKDKEGKIFNHLVHLETIDLSENKISVIPRLLFGSQVNIRNVHLASNLIERLHFQIEHMISMEAEIPDYFMTKFKRKRGSNLLDLSYDFDAFVSENAEEDQHFVHETFLTNIEEGAELGVCLHKRDFLVGNEIAANITDAIHRSRKTVCIISHHFLNSYWCMFEFNMARMESIYSRDGENIVYLIFLEQIPTKTLPLILLELVQSQSYIEFPNDEYGDTIFWENLKKYSSI
ncbi:unnamed protein product [Mytilus coruscus]|uniref:TIR domain-containing protein n=1 Tax=Mytilus coruscus TaxID=42192 RepID=A0A6J8EHZ6_MYTCO|nr:unnamed protein product [Mytilus coruscus]